MLSMAQNRAAVRDERVSKTLDNWAYASLCAFVACLPWGEIFPTVGGFVPTNWLVLVPIALVAARVILTGRLRKPCPLHYILMIFIAWVGASLAWTVDEPSTVSRLGSYVQLLAFVLVIWELATTEERVQTLVLSYAAGAFIASAITFYNSVTGQSVTEDRTTVEGVNADELAILIALGLPMALYLLILTKNQWVKLFCWAEIIAGTVAILLTGTRGGLFAAMIGTSLMVVLVFRRFSLAQQFLLIVACLVILAGVIRYVPSATVRRFLDAGTEVTQGTLTHRTQLWAAGLEVYRDHPFLGVGAGAYAPAIVHIVDIPIFAHNTFISVLVELGVFGALVLVALLGAAFFYALGLRYLERSLWFALLATWVVGVSSVTWEYRKATWFVFGLVAAHAYARSQRALRFVRHDQPLPGPVAGPRAQRLRPSPGPKAARSGRLAHAPPARAPVSPA